MSHYYQLFLHAFAAVIRKRASSSSISRKKKCTLHFLKGEEKKEFIFQNTGSNDIIIELLWRLLQFQKPYKCEVVGCIKRYTDPSSLRKHVKSHSQEEQLQYRRSKDLANMAKRSCSPTARWVRHPQKVSVIFYKGSGENSAFDLVLGESRALRLSL